VAIAYTVGVLCVYEAMDEDPSERVPVTVTMERAGQESDLPDQGTTPDQRTEYEAPDSSDTRTDCFQVPKWLTEQTTRGERIHGPPSSEPAPSASPETLRSDPLGGSYETSTAIAGPGYGIIPKTNARPRVSVGSRSVTVPVFDRRGALTTYEYDLPRDTWRVTLGLHGTALQGAAVASTSLQVRRRTALGWVGVGPAYSAVIAGDVRSGAGVTVSFNTTLWSN